MSRIFYHNKTPTCSHPLLCPPLLETPALPPVRAPPAPPSLCPTAPSLTQPHSAGCHCLPPSPPRLCTPSLSSLNLWLLSSACPFPSRALYQHPHCENCSSRSTCPTGELSHTQQHPPGEGDSQNYPPQVCVCTSPMPASQAGCTQHAPG